jgi:hypothetical protein
MLANSINIPNEKVGNDGYSIMSQKSLLQASMIYPCIYTQMEKRKDAIGPMRNRLEIINVIGGDSGATDEEASSISSIKVKIGEVHGTQSEQNTIQLEDKGSRVENWMLMEFEEGEILEGRDNMREIKFSEEFSSIVFQSKNINTSDIAF